jgi:hypothetical protein
MEVTAGNGIGGSLIAGTLSGLDFTRASIKWERLFVGLSCGCGVKQRIYDMNYIVTVEAQVEADSKDEARLETVGMLIQHGVLINEEWQDWVVMDVRPLDL